MTPLRKSFRYCDDRSSHRVESILETPTTGVHGNIDPCILTSDHLHGGSHRKKIAYLRSLSIITSTGSLRRATEPAGTFTAASPPFAGASAMIELLVYSSKVRNSTPEKSAQLEASSGISQKQKRLKERQPRSFWRCLLMRTFVVPFPLLAVNPLTQAFPRSTHCGAAKY